MQDTSNLAHWCIIQRSPLGLLLAWVRAGHMTRAIARARLIARLGSKNTSQGGHQNALLKLCSGQQIAHLEK